MLVLNENSLGKRQHELNAKVREAFENKLNFDEIKLQEEKSDIDKLFKIDLASLYKNIDYISETLKCGDSLYISRVLKCTWIYEDEFKHFLNPDNLDQNIFPFMSTKMKKKTLTTIATNITDSERVHAFYKYCISSQLDNIAFDYLLKTSESVKSEFITKHIHINRDLNWEHFFGNSLDLIKLYLEKRKWALNNVDQDIYNFRYLFSSSAETYLHMLETYTEPPSPYNCHYHHEKFGLRMSKEIMTKHKHRVLEKPWLYLRKLNTKMIVKHSNSVEAKQYIVSMLPDVVNNFWNMNFYKKYIDFFNLLPEDEKYTFLKKIFNEKYPLDHFETSIQFYRLKYYELLTDDERNAWALKHIEEKKELLGPGRDYLWYRFVKFEKAFSDVLKKMYVTNNPKDRSGLLEVLIESASDLEHLEKLLSYYYTRHVNESSNNKEQFLDKIIEVHNVFKFPDSCWSPFHKLLYSLNYDNSGHYSDKYVMMVIVYNIIHNNKIPENLESFCVFRERSCFYTLSMHLKKLNKEQQDLIYQTFMNFFLSKIEKLSANVSDGDEEKQNDTGVVQHIHSILTLMQSFDKAKEDCPDVVINLVQLHFDEFKNNKWFTSQKKPLKEADLLRFLKKDKMLLVQKLEDVKDYPFCYKILNLKRLLQKVKIYFSNDIRINFLTFFENWLADKEENRWIRNIYQIVFALFQLADDNYKISFMSEYAPTEAKIQHDVINRDLLKIQEAICRFAYYSRPPVPLENMLQYIKGDYVKFCLPMFNSYLVNLPLPQSLKFIETILNSPVSIQKHGLRLAFVSYSDENLKQLVTDLWKKTRNVTLRAIIYKSLFEKIKKANDVVQPRLYEVLKILTLDLIEDDHDEIFDLTVSSSLPGNLNGNYLQTSWIAVQKLPDHSTANVNRKINVIRGITSYIEQVDREFCQTEIIDKHIQNQLVEKGILRFNNSYGVNGLVDEKWNLTAKYLTHFDNEEQQKDCVKLLETIMKKCLEMWDEIYDIKFVVRAFLYNFVNRLVDETDYRKDSKDKSYILPIYEKIIEFLTSTRPLVETYHIVLYLRLVVLGRASIGVGEFASSKQVVTYDHLSVTEVSEKFAKGIIQFIDDLKSKQQFYPSFYSDIANSINETMQIMTSWTNLVNDNLKINVCLALTKFDNKEAYMLATNLLPVEVDKKHKDSHLSIIRIINEFNDDEVTTFMYHKFILPNFTARY